MKNLLFLALAFSCLHAMAQNLIPLNGTDAIRVGELPETRALIVGIADYKDSLIGDLHYANKDAEIFTDYLRSEAGGALPEQNIWQMTNKEATLGAIDNALNWLITETKKGDKVIIYFSGHGDVERKTLWQRGYLLTYNTPAYNYRNNAIRVEELDEIIKTLSVGNEAKVVVILDACRSGKLATAGPNLTAEQLEKQVENEVRILSCKSDQKSLEGELWGKGRGLFSFYLINGLKGLADKAANDDRLVTFEELRAFLEKNMSEALNRPGLEGRRQNPVFVGDERFELANVEDEMLADAARDMGIAAAEPRAGTQRRGVGEKSPEKNLEADMTASMQDFDFSAAVLDADFEAVLEKNSADSLLDFFAKNSGLNTENAEDARLALAARLHDQAQEVINLYLLGDARTLDQRNYIDQAEKYVQYPRMLQAALILLPENHLLRRNVEVKLHYFDGVCTRLAGQMSNDPKSKLSAAFAKQKRALALDDKAAYVHNEMGLLYLTAGQLDSALIFFQTATELAPNWALPQVNLCAVAIEKGQYDEAKAHGEKAVALQPGYFGAYLNLGVVAEKKHDLLAAETYFRKARELNDPNYRPFERRASLLLESTRYSEAEWQYYEMEIRKQGAVPPLPIVTVAESPQMSLPPVFKYPSLSEPGKVYRNPNSAKELFMTGKAYFEQNDYAAAEPYLKQAMRIEPSHNEVYYYLGTICAEQGRYEEAEVYLKRLIALRQEVALMPVFLGELYKKWGRLESAEQIYRNFLATIQSHDLLLTSYLSLSEICHTQGRFSEQEQLLWDLYDLNSIFGTYELVMFYNDMLEKYPNDAALRYRFADFEYKIIGHRAGIFEFEKLVALDSNAAAIGHVLALIGRYYLKEVSQPYASESLPNWRAGIPKAIQYLELSARKAPTVHAVKYDLAAAYLKIFQYDEAIAVLDSLYKNGGLDFPNRLVFADLQLRSGQFEAAKQLIDKAWDIQPEAVPGLAGLNAKWHLLNGEPDKAMPLYKQELSFAKDREKAYIIYTLARIYAQKGEKSKALELLWQATDNGFDCPLVMKYDPVWAPYMHLMAFVDLYQKALTTKQAMAGIK